MTNHKNIGNLYFVFGARSGTTGTTLKTLICAKIDQPGLLFYMTVFTTVHTVIIISFIAVPILEVLVTNYYL